MFNMFNMFKKKKMVVSGWLYFGCYSPEGDNIKVVKREIVKAI